MSNAGSALVPGAGPAPKADREQWVDVAKGGAIVLVLLHHAWETLYADRPGFAPWGLVDQSLASMRMPTFFMVSGLFAGGRPAAGALGAEHAPGVCHARWAIVLAIAVLPCFGGVFNPPLITVFATAGCVAAARILRPQWYLFSLPAPGRV